MSRSRWLYALSVVVVLAACQGEREFNVPATPVRTEIARRSGFTPAITILGVIRAAQSVPLTAQQRGTIRYPHRFSGGLLTGTHVDRGEVVAEVENDDVRAAQTEARLEMDAAAADFDRADRSFKLGVISSAEHSGYSLRAALAKEKYIAAEKRTATMRIAAPDAGTLVVTHVYPSGSTVDPAAVLAEIATAGAPLVECNAAASDRALLRPGLPVAFTARATPPWTGTGRIAEVASVVSDAGTARIVAAIDRNATAPPPGTGVEMTVQLEQRGAALTVPEDAVVAGTDGPALFVAAATEGSNRFRVKRVTVTTGGRSNGRIEITSGLRDGERVVVNGADALADDAVASEANDKAPS